MTLSATYINIAATGGAGSVMTDLRADELVKLADRIVSQPTSWLPITGHCRNITFTLDECDVIATALRRLAEAGTQPEPVAWQFQCANGAWIACDRPSPSELSDEPDKFRCLYTTPPAPSVAVPSPPHVVTSGYSDYTPVTVRGDNSALITAAQDDVREALAGLIEAVERDTNGSLAAIPLKDFDRAVAALNKKRSQS